MPSMFHADVSDAFNPFCLMSVVELDGSLGESAPLYAMIANSRQILLIDIDTDNLAF